MTKYETGERWRKSKDGWRGPRKKEVNFKRAPIKPPVTTKNFTEHTIKI